ncbi:MAG: 4Fe-4S cluster-binding domain-containing protein [Muribaculaceae bacterium]|nr:4Fe-4S cluster-binding domain-containing protein [Muribaculaceae bacterium]
MKNPIKALAGAVGRWNELRRMPLRLEFVLTDTCNLNCKGCTHYSPLAPKEFADLELMERNMEHLAAVCGDEVQSLYLIGGETLLYPQLIEVMEALRRHFPSRDLYIFTNGIALPKMDDRFWATASRLGFIIAITRYPIRFDYDAAIELCRSNGVRTEVFGDRSLADTFFKFALDPEKKQNPRLSHFKCYNRGCLSVVGDRLYPCSISGCVSHLNRATGTDFRHSQGDYLQIDRITSVKQIFNLRNKPVPFCGYCIQPARSVGYGPSRRDKFEWVNGQ